MFTSRSHAFGPLNSFAQLGVLAQALPLGSGPSDYGNMGLIGMALSAGFTF